jgi:hypothetical protein
MNKTTCWFLLVGLCGLIQVTRVYAFNPDRDPSLIGCWKLDETSGTTAHDSSANANNGTVMGNPKWAAGKLQGCLDFDGTGDYVDCGNSPVFTFTDAITVSTWVNIRAVSVAWMAAVAKGEVAWRLGVNNMAQTFHWAITDYALTNYSTNGTIQVPTNEWHHVAGTFDGTDIKLYIDGVLDSTTPGTSGMGTSANNVLIGENPGATGRNWNGLLDDIRIYRRALSVDEIRALMVGGAGPGPASSPSPADRATDVPRDSVLSWEPGDFADTHDVYFGTSFADVNSASRTAPGTILINKGQSDTTYDPGRLEFGRTYYWRVDEVNAPPSTKIFTGDVWSFTVEAFSDPVTDVNATASSFSKAGLEPSKTVDGSGLDPNTDQHSTTPGDMWLSGPGFPQWIQYTFDKVYKLDKMWVWNSNQALENLLGFGAKDVLVQYSVDGTAWTDVGNFVFNQAPGTPDYIANTDISFGGAAAKYVKLTISSSWGGILPGVGLSEVRFYAIPVAAREPAPADDATNVNPQVTFSWRAGREAGSHEVYVGTDPNAVADSTTPPVTTTQAQYEAPLDLENTYYWKVVEVNQAEDPSAWPSDVWSFSTATYISVDDFESYTNESPKRVFQAWIDGSGFSPDEYFPNGSDGNGTGSLVGYDPMLGNIMEKAYFYAGKQSMPLYYDNSAAPKISEAIRTFDPVQDWTKHSLTTLVLFFRGDPANGAAPVYVKINNTKKLYNNGAAATTTPIWKQWNIDLASIPAADLKAVKTLTIGVGDGSAGGTGTILVDDIRLYATAPAVAVPTDPGTTGLEALYSMEGDAKDSSGKGHDGTINGEPGFVDGPAGYGKALAFDGVNDYVDLPIGNLLSTLGGSTFAARVEFSGSAGSWQRVFDFGTGTTNYMFLTPRQGTAGAMRFAIRTATITEQLADAPIALPSGWHHVAVVFDNASMVIGLYMDGVQISRGATTLLPKDLGVTTQNWLGRSQFTADAYFTGSIDDFRIYSRPLSEGEIRYLAGDR